MQDSDIPVKFPVPWANSAGGAFIRAIPTASQIGIVPGEASLTDGWPPLTALPVAGGGIPPDIRDMNGILFRMTAWDRWAQAGGRIAWDSAFSAAVGGYPQGAIVSSATTLGLQWLCTADNNTTNPDTGGAGWISSSFGRLLNIQTILASGTYTPTPGTKNGLVEVEGGGGAGGGSGATAAGQCSAGSGGAAGGWARKYILGITSQMVTIGTGGTGASDSAGSNGGTTSFGAIVSATGGIGGTRGAPVVTSVIGPVGGSTGGSGAGGDENAVGGHGHYALYCANPLGGEGGQSRSGAGGTQTSGQSNGNAGVSKGSGGSGGCVPPSGTASTGGAGVPGISTIWEFSQ